MSDAMDPTVRHPDELLAGYVDGSATPDERDVVEQHLATCATCQEEVQLATEARAALISLPELGAPGLAEAGVPALRRAAFQAVPADLPSGEAAPSAPSSAPATVPAGPRSRRSRLAWAQLAAAAAIVVVVGGLVAIPLLLSDGGSKTSRPSAEGGAARAPAESLPVLIDRGANYSQEQLDALARQLGTAIRKDSPSRGALAVASPLPSPIPTGPVADSAAASTAVECVLSGGGPSDGAQLIYLEQAEFLGTPSYIGGFFLPTAKLNIMAVAVTRDGCQPLYSVRQSA